jgi:hypothetical protein
VNVVETARLKPGYPQISAKAVPVIVEKPASAWGQVAGKLCTAGDTGVDNFTPVIPGVTIR